MHASTFANDTSPVSSTSSSTKQHHRVAFAVGCSLGGFVGLVALVGLYLLHRRRRRRDPFPPEPGPDTHSLRTLDRPHVPDDEPEDEPSPVPEEMLNKIDE